MGGKKVVKKVITKKRQRKERRNGPKQIAYLHPLAFIPSASLEGSTKCCEGTLGTEMPIGAGSDWADCSFLEGLTLTLVTDPELGLDHAWFLALTKIGIVMTAPMSLRRGRRTTSGAILRANVCLR